MFRPPKVMRRRLLLASALTAFVALPIAESIAQPAGGRGHGGGGGAARSTGPRSSAGHAARPSGAPRAQFRAPSAPRVQSAPRIQRQFRQSGPGVATPRLRQSTPRIQRQFRAPGPGVATPTIRRQLQQRTPRIVTPKPSAPATVAPSAAAVPRVTRQRLRRLPSSAATINRGLRASPGFAKPPAVAHNASRRAGKAGWQHRHKPFFFKRGGHRWKRIYYTYPIGGRWYWYWYDVMADDDPAAVVYSYDALPECDGDDDDCSYVENVSDGELIAPAILEGRATEEMMERCEDRYRSFDRRTGTYTAYSGEKRVCRYLR